MKESARRLLREALIKSVIPAKAGIHLDLKRGFIESKWIPAFAGMTIYGLNQSFLRHIFPNPETTAFLP